MCGYTPKRTCYIENCKKHHRLLVLILYGFSLSLLLILQCPEMSQGKHGYPTVGDTMK